MFTGIIREVGIVKALNGSGNTRRLDIDSQSIFNSANLGESVSVNGVCLTIVKTNGNVLSFDIMDETIKRSNLKSLLAGDRVNLEPALKADGKMDGHFVLGHIDCTGKIFSRTDTEETVISIKIPKDFSHLLVEKGSVAIDGISLTVGDIKDDMFNLYLIPYTLKETNLGERRTGDEVNIEFDIIGKYVARLSGYGKRSRITEDFLKENGF